MNRPSKIFSFMSPESFKVINCLTVKFIVFSIPSFWIHCFFLCQKIMWILLLSVILRNNIVFILHVKWKLNKRDTALFAMNFVLPASWRCFENANCTTFPLCLLGPFIIMKWKIWISKIFFSFVRWFFFIQHFYVLYSLLTNCSWKLVPTYKVLSIEKIWRSKGLLQLLNKYWNVFNY